MNNVFQFFLSSVLTFLRIEAFRMYEEVIVTPIGVLRGLLVHAMEVYNSLLLSLRGRDRMATLRAYEELSATLMDIRDGINTHRYVHAQAEVHNLLIAQNQIAEALHDVLQ